MFSVLTSKIFGGTTIALLLVVTAMGWKLHSRDNTIAKLEKTVSDQKVEIATFKGNVASLDAGLKVCNASVDNAKAIADQVAAAGKAALAEVRKNAVALDKRINAIDAMPASTCGDAEAILRAGAVQ